jgi:hypothetical protein
MAVSRRPAPSGPSGVSGKNWISRLERLDETVPHSADVLAEQHGAKLLPADRRIVEPPE